MSGKQASAAVKEAFTVEMRPLESITSYGNNPRFNDQAVSAVADSIKQFGFRQPIVVDEAGVIVVGHTRWKAAKKLKLREVPVHVARGLSEEQVRAYRLADNRTNEDASWDFDKLAEELSHLPDVSLSAFDPVEIAGLLETESPKITAEDDKRLEKFIAAREKMRDRPQESDGFWLCACFASEAQLTEFVKQSKLEPLFHRYINGVEVAKRMGLSLKEEKVHTGGRDRVYDKLKKASGSGSGPDAQAQVG